MIFIDKKNARQQQLTRLQQLDSAKRQQETKHCQAKLFNSDFWQNAQTIATTWSSPIEVSTREIIARAQIDGKTVLLPKTMPHRQMAFLPYTTADALVKSSFGLMEPAYQAELVEQQPDLLIVPGLAFSTSNHFRLGFGGGYYDRFLAQYTGITVSLVLSVQQFDQPFWPVESFDIAIQNLITV